MALAPSLTTLRSLRPQRGPPPRPPLLAGMAACQRMRQLPWAAAAAVAAAGLWAGRTGRHLASLSRSLQRRRAWSLSAGVAGVGRLWRRRALLRRSTSGLCQLCQLLPLRPGALAAAAAVLQPPGGLRLLQPVQPVAAARPWLAWGRCPCPLMTPWRCSLTAQRTGACLLPLPPSQPPWPGLPLTSRPGCAATRACWRPGRGPSRPACLQRSSCWTGSALLQRQSCSQLLAARGCGTSWRLASAWPSATGPAQPCWLASRQTCARATTASC